MPRFTVITTTTVQAADLREVVERIVADHEPGEDGSPWVTSCPPLYDAEGAYASFAPATSGGPGPVSYFVRTNR